MLFTYRYPGATRFSHSATATTLAFAPDTLRPPVAFDGAIDRKLPFREAMAALHDVVVSDLRIKPNANVEAYKAWARQREEIEVGLMQATDAKLKARAVEVERELRELGIRSTEVFRGFDRQKHRYFQYLLKSNRALWVVLDPVVTVHPDRLFFEAFSLDESSYGCLSCGGEVFRESNARSSGTTNVDYSAALAQEILKIRDYKDTRLQLDPGGLSLQTGDDTSYREVKIDLPESWVRGFLQVNAAMALDAASFDLQPMDLWNLCFALRRRKELKGPRSLRFRLEPGRPVEVEVEPWGEKILCPRSLYPGETAREIRLWGRRRLHILERLLPIARRFRLHLLGTGLPSFFVADLGPLTFTLGLSGWTRNDWSRLGQFDLMAPRAEADAYTRQQVVDALRRRWVASPAELAAECGLERKIVLGALAAGAQSGQVFYELETGLYRYRDLTREPLPLDRLRFANEREQEARTLLPGLAPGREVEEGGVKVVRGNVPDQSKTYQVSIRIDRDERLIDGSTCTCSFYVRNKLYQGPCRHMLALRMATTGPVEARR